MVRQRIKIANRKDDLTLNEAFNEFMRKAKIRNLSSETMKTYSNVIKIFFEFMDEGTKTHDISASDVDEYILWLKEEKEIRDTTVVNYVRHLRAFLYYCMDCGYIKKFKIGGIFLQLIHSSNDYHQLHL